MSAAAWRRLRGRPWSIASLLGLLIVLSGCVPRYGVKTFRDDFEGLTVHRMRGNVLDDPGRGGEWIELNAELRRVRGSDAPQLGMALLYRDSHRWLHVPAGETLLILADGERIALRGQGSSRSRRKAHLRGVEERAVYGISAEHVRRIAGADTVRVRILGRREYVERSFGEANRQRIREFVATHLDPPSSPPAEPAPQP